MKIIAINGSPKSKGNTYHSLAIMGEEFAKQGIEFEILHVGHKAIHGCIGCGRCAEAKTEQCPSFPDDIVNESVQKLKSADGIILASTVYYSGVAGTMKCFLDRAFYVAGVNKGLFRHKIGAKTHGRLFDTRLPEPLFHNFRNAHCLVDLLECHSWNGSRGGCARRRGRSNPCKPCQNMAWLLQIRAATADTVPIPDVVKVARTNFVR